MKGLPLTYSKDMQEDKEPVFDAISSLSLAIAAMEGMVSDLTANEARMRAAASRGFATATDLADWLVTQLGLAFRDAHHVTGTLVALAEKKGTDLEGLSLAEMQKVHPGITKDIFKAITVEASVAARKSLGGTAPANVKRQAQRWLKLLS
jgi:argininosuccinate lyase